MQIIDEVKYGINRICFPTSTNNNCMYFLFITRNLGIAEAPNVISFLLARSIRIQKEKERKQKEAEAKQKEARRRQLA